MKILGLTSQEFWIGVIPLCVVGLIYFGGDVLREFISEDHRTAFRWGDAQRRTREPATWGAHLVIAPVCLFIAGLALRLILKW